MPLPVASAGSPATREPFRHDPAEGALRLADGAPAVALSEPVIQGLHFALVEAAGENAQDVLYRTGYEWALQDMLRLNRQLQEQFGSGHFDFWQTDAKFVLDTWWAPLAAGGWGGATFGLAALTRGLLFVELRQSPVATAFSGADHPVCHLHAGLFAGALSFFDRAERHAVEVQCLALGAESCRFIVGPGAEVDSAEAWRQQGTSAAEIVRRFN